MKRKGLFLSLLLIAVLLLGTSCTENLKPSGKNETEAAGEVTTAGDAGTDGTQEVTEPETNETPEPVLPSYGPVELPKHSF